MVNLLVVEDDAIFRLLIGTILRGHDNLHLIEAHSVAEATTALKKGRVDVLLTDLRLEDGDGLDLIGALPGLSPVTLPILMSSVATARDHQSAMRLGAVEVLTKPFTKDELLRALQRAVDSATGFRGSVHGLSLTDLLQMFSLARRSLVLEIRGARSQGAVVFHEGELIHAHAGPRTGVDALRALLAMQAGTMHTLPYQATERTIEGPFQEVLMDAFREMDEQNSEPPPSAPRLSLKPSLPPPSTYSLALQTYVSQLDPELGVAILHRDRIESLTQGRLSPEQWQRLGELGRRLRDRAGPGPSWSQVQWVINDVGVTLLRSVSGLLVLLGQQFIDRLDDRRFRWNVARVDRFLREEPGVVSSPLTPQGAP
jgi:CheY-like chemotaxis protein